MDAPKPTQILCNNQRSVKHAICAVCSAVSKAIEDSSQLNNDQKKRLTKRFIEMYETTQHENILIDGQVWGDYNDVVETTQQPEYEPVNVKRRLEVEELAVTTDSQTVTTTRKRKKYPKAITQQIARKLMAEHAALEEFQPTPDANVNDEINFSLSQDNDDIVSERLQESAECILTSTKTFPALDDKCERVDLALRSYYRMQDSKTSKIIAKPTPEESTMATSVTQLRSRVTDKTPSPVKRNDSDEINVKRILKHPISYNLRQTSSKKI